MTVEWYVHVLFLQYYAIILLSHSLLIKASSVTKVKMLAKVICIIGYTNNFFFFVRGMIKRFYEKPCFLLLFDFLQTYSSCETIMYL